jgi:hypothetical protein
MMNKEQKRLLTMLQENKISVTDYQLISEALNKKSVFADIENSMLINPFQKIAGSKALLIGLILMVVMSIVGAFANIYYDGSLGYFLAHNLKTGMKPNFWLLFYQNMIGTLTLASLFFITALFFRQKKIRFIDFFGTVALARYPMYLSVIYTALENLIFPEINLQDISKGIELHFSFVGSVSAFIFFTCFIWQLVICFFALKEASGLEGKRLWSGYMIAMLISEVIGTIFTRLFLYV